MEPTPQQQLILEHDGNTVVIASPGSGKTFVLSEKIKLRLKELKDYQGIVAISYTNKASNELKTRSLSTGLNPKNSFFGTIDRFFIAEIIIPFGKQLFGIPKNEIRVGRIATLPEGEHDQFQTLTREIALTALDRTNLELLRTYFSDGIILIETVGVFANYVFTNSLACRKYISARYKYIFIDEYQDSGVNQHELFLKIVELGLIGFVVGDINQSIYAFSGKNSRFLSDLSNFAHFKLFSLNKNHRCESSIINYSNYLLNPDVELIPVEETKVFFCRIEGDEINVAKWLDIKINSIKEAFNVTANNEIAILCRANRIGETIHTHLKTSHKLSISSDLDNSFSIWSSIFSNLLRFVFDETYKFIEIVEEFTAYQKITKPNRQKLMLLKDVVVELFRQRPFYTGEIINIFSDIAEIIAPYSFSYDSQTLLKRAIESEDVLSSYKPASEHEVNILTLHKSKGLQFEVVIHLDLNERIIPSQSRDYLRKTNFPEWKQFLNLHYVGITRARKACILVANTKRTNYYGAISDYADSEFLYLNGIENLRRGSKPK